MTEKCLYILKVNEDFKALITPLSPEELQQLEQNIVNDGCREPLCVWYNTILDGHNRYEICTRLQIPFSIKRMNFKSCEQATSWICANQLGRLNITDEMRKYLIGKRYEMEKIIDAHNAARINPRIRKEAMSKILPEHSFDANTYRTCERLGKEYRMSYATICKYGVYAHALETMSKVVPELTSKVLSGQVKISHENIVEMSQLSPKDIRILDNQISNDNIEIVRYSDMRKVLPAKPGLPKQSPSIPTGSVKDMPVYDPDSEISGLTFTIPSWVSSINRTRSVAKLSEISINARSKLEKELLGLKETIDTMLAAIKEEI